MMKTLLVTTALALAFSPQALADNHTEGKAETVQIGPEIGAQAPEFSALTSAGEVVDFAVIAGENGAVIVFNRSLDWCPYCKKQAIELQTVADDLATAGWPLSVITYDSPEVLAEFGAEKELTYTLLSDTGSAMIDAFGLRNADMKAGSRFDGVPHPAIVFISNDGIIRGVQREEGYKDRPPSESLPQLVALLNMPAE